MRRVFFVMLLVQSASPAEAQKNEVDKERAPRVKSISPANGATGVDPTLGEIRVVFDLAMSRGGFSFVGEGPSFPHTTGPPRWEDAYTCVLPVRLRPDRAYSFGLNGDRFQNFRSYWDVPLAPVEVTFRTGGLETIERNPEEQRKLNVDSFDALTNAIRNKYSYLELRSVDWEKLFASHRYAVVGEETVAGWARRAAKMLADAGDVHLTLEYDGASVPTFVRRVAPNFGWGGVREVIPELGKRNECVATGKTAGGIGYVLIRSWGGDCVQDLAAVHEALGEFVDAPALVIDVRPNSGGSEELAKRVAAWFVDERRVYAKHSFRRGPEPGDFTPVRERTIEPNPVGRRYRGPVAVLMGRGCMSSCEAFLLMMKQSDRVTLMGERSYGSSGNPKATYLPNGVKAFIPSWKAMRPDGRTFEGEGIAPDVVISSEGVDFERRDPVLESALRLLGDQLSVDAEK